MNYRHSFHAGNFADVFKHVLLCGLLTALSRKDKPWCYIDTHAGTGRYRLQDVGQPSPGEWRDGIARLLSLTEAPPPLASYLNIIRAANAGLTLSADSAQLNYPGSPAIARALSRTDDQLLLCEQVPEVMQTLRKKFHRDPRTALHQRDGFEAYALLPLAQKRGLLLVDPPFEQPDDFAAMAKLSQRTSQRFPGGVQALWYPAKNPHAVGHFLRRMENEGSRPMLNILFDTGAPRTAQVAASGIVKQPLHACGLLIVNPPYQFQQDMDASLQQLVPLLAQGSEAACTSQMLRSE